MSFPYCPDCEVHHPSGLCDLVHYARTADDVQLELAGDPGCGWAAWPCDQRATHRVRLYRRSGPGRVLVEDRDLCTDHALDTSVLTATSQQLGWEAEADPLPDPHDPKLLS